MASVTSHTSTHTSPFDFDHTDDESWQYVDYSSGASAHESVGFLPSPASGSLSGYAVVGHTHGHLTSPQASAVSPLSLVDVGQPMFLPAEASFAGQEGFGTLEDDAAFVQGIASTSGNGNGNGNNNRSGLTPHEYLFADGGLSQHEFNDMAPFMSNFFTNEQTMTATDFTPSSHFQTDTSITSWDATIPTAADTQIITLEDLVPSSHSITSSSSPSGCSSQSPAVELDMSKPPIATRKATDAKIEKKTKRPSASQAGKFVIMTPESIASRTGRPNPFECFEAMRATQRGRKGPLANVTKENALQVRRLGACFCCHSRKVKCDKERPCKHCKRLMLHVPQVMCWQFQDFIPILFPEFVRAHFKKGEMVKFLRDNVDCFTARSCEVELFSGPRFSAVLRVDANFFTARSRHVLRHWHTSPQGGSRNMQAQGSAPIGLEFNTAAQRDHLRKRVKGYVADIVNEPMYAEQVTDSVTSTQLPVKILRIVQAYARQSDSTLDLQPSGLVPQDTPFVTPRVLARQVKSLIDQLILRETQAIFELFSKSLKPKHRCEWAPCVAAFLVLCLFMEAVETTAENFVMYQNEMDMRNASPPRYKRGFALAICTELENMPFKQFAYQFHTIYQTHAKDVNTKSFNPLFDHSFEAQGELDGPAVEMVRKLRELFAGEDWQDMQFLADDEIILNRGDESAHPIDSSFLYTGRLVAKFLLSFTDENAIFGGQI
ncbi:Zn(2)-C6 fungal-type DNA-binding domain protein [Metarhizium rileyi]|uniref:Zn(2)-C6 fungal-type DNA-binding domain protein n=1 Tax=Metarhizium rileyi (strain RCEF 4871) TaxID=1649241 RepID=A0A167JKG4_METRR|nr:Zn(2)-C6 fungal-type DNA-binding domain protein [Metarhizium rileyi RCEF 4871]